MQIEPTALPEVLVLNPPRFGDARGWLEVSWSRAALAETGLEPSHLSQHLGTLRRHGVVTSVRTANVVTYRLAHPKIKELLAIARAFLLDTLAGSSEQLRIAQELPAGHLDRAGGVDSAAPLDNTAP